MSMETLFLRGILKGHNGWVTAIATPQQGSGDKIVSSSRDKTVIAWTLTRDDPMSVGFPQRSFTGHSHFVEDVVLSSDAQYALSCSWDKTLRLWNLGQGDCARTFVGHTKDVMTVAFSADNRQIVSGSRDRTIKLWNTLGECKHTITPEESGNAHTDWVSCTRTYAYSPDPSTHDPRFVSCGWDKAVKVWTLRNCELHYDLPNVASGSEEEEVEGHTGYINTITVSPDGSLCASGGKDGTAMLWDLNDGKHLYSLEAGDIINALAFSPNRYWLVAATNQDIKIWDLESKKIVSCLNKNVPEFFGAQKVFTTPNPACISLAWSADGTTLFAGYTDNVIRVWEVRQG